MEASKQENNNGPKTNPCGTPYVREALLEVKGLWLRVGLCLSIWHTQNEKQNKTKEVKGPININISEHFLKVKVSSFLKEKNVLNK